VIAVSQDIDEPLAPKTKVKLRRSRSQGSSVSNNHQDELYSLRNHHKRRKRARISILSSVSSSRSISAHTHESKDEIQLRKFLVEATGIDKRKFKPGNVQPTLHWLHDAETRRWRRENIWPTSEPGPYSPAEGTHAYVELAKAISTIESSLLNALYADQIGESAKQYIIDAYLLILTAGASFKLIREAANLSGWKRNHILNHHFNNISRETQLELEHEAKLYASNKTSGYNGALIGTVAFPRSPDKCKTPSVLERMVKKGKWRKILDCQIFDRQIQVESFKMEGVREIKDLLQQGDYATSLDLHQAYHHIAVPIQIRPFLAFYFEK
ncbi:MAG: hypothetical protein EZS28_044211, partial [Streblomastix strix]